MAFHTFKIILGTVGPAAALSSPKELTFQLFSLFMFNINHPLCSPSARLGCRGSRSRCCGDAARLPFGVCRFYQAPRAEALLGGGVLLRARHIAGCSGLVGWHPVHAPAAWASAHAWLGREIFKLGKTPRAAPGWGAPQNPLALCCLPAWGCCHPSPREWGWFLFSRPQILAVIYSSPKATRPGWAVPRAHHTQARRG